MTSKPRPGGSSALAAAPDGLTWLSGLGLGVAGEEIARVVGAATRLATSRAPA